MWLQSIRKRPGDVVTRPIVNITSIHVCRPWDPSGKSKLSFTGALEAVQACEGE